jgi:sialate O-acetylesterase
MLFPTLGYGIRGVIWYQGEANIDDADLYDKLFPLLIGQWRRDWKNPELPFYWVQLPTHGERDPSLLFDGAWPTLRDAQTKTMQLPHTGQAVTIDIGDGNNMHPKNKLDVAARLARWALVKDYGMTMPFQSPTLYSIAPKPDGKITLTFDFVGRGLCTRETDAVSGFAVCGADRVWHWAMGDITQYNTVDVWCDAVPKPTAVRYGWTDNPNCNLFSKDGLPATPFRTDDFEVKLPVKPAPTPPGVAPPAGNAPGTTPPPAPSSVPALPVPPSPPVK